VNSEGAEASLADNAEDHRLFFLKAGRVGEDDGEQVARRRRAVDGAGEALLDEVGKIAAVVNVGVAEDDRIDVSGREGEGRRRAAIGPLAAIAPQSSRICGRRLRPGASSQ
jgi:hypothetical protein